MRQISFEKDVNIHADGSCLVKFGNTHVLCNATVEARVPPWMRNSGRGWVTAEYGMLPGSTGSRKRRDRGGSVDGRTIEIQRLIARSLRAVVDTQALGEKLVTVDCDVLQADGGTRTASICGGWLALYDCLKVMEKQELLFKWPLTDQLAALSVGMVGDDALLDLCYEEDSRARADVNVVMTGSGNYVEIQGTGEGASFTPNELQQMLGLAKTGIGSIVAAQKESLEKDGDQGSRIGSAG